MKTNKSMLLTEIVLNNVVFCSLKRLVLFLCLLLLILNSYGQTLVEYEIDISSYICYEYNVSSSYYTITDLSYVGGQIVGDFSVRRRQAQRFDISDIPSYATVQTAELLFHAGPDLGASPGTLYFTSIRQDFASQPYESVFGLIYSGTNLGSKEISYWREYSISSNNLKNAIQTAVQSSTQYIGIGAYNLYEFEGRTSSLLFQYLKGTYSIPTPREVRDLNISSVTSTGCILSWTAPYVGGGSGAATGYYVKVGNELYSNTTSTSVVIQGLCPGANYTLHVIPYNIYGNGPDRTVPLTTLSTTISEPDVVCLFSTNFTVNNLPPSSNVTWNPVPQPNNGDYSITFSGNECTITNNHHIGEIILTATITNNCGTTYISKNILLTYSPSYYTLYPKLTTGGNTDWLKDNNCLLTYTFPGMYSGDIEILDPAGYPIITNVTWTKISQTGCSFADFAPSNNGKNVFLNFKPLGCRATLRMTASNDCGSFSYDFSFNAGESLWCSVIPEMMYAAPISGKEIIIYPNPTTGEFTIDYSSKNTESGINEIIITNNLGKNILTEKYNDQKTVTLDLSGQSAGLYFLELFDGKEWTCHKINVNK